MPAGAALVVAGAWGARPGEFGCRTDPESNAEGPMAAIAGEDGELDVLDQVNQRIQRFRGGRLRAIVPIRSAAAQDLARLATGGFAVLDRLARPSVQIYQASGLPGRVLSLDVAAPLQAGGVTGLHADASGVYIERGHQSWLRLAGADGEPAEPTELFGRPGRDSRLLVRAALANAARGEVMVEAAAWPDAQLAWQRRVQLGARALELVLLDTDGYGRTYVGARVGDERAEAPYEIVGEALVVIRLAPDGSPAGRLHLPCRSLGEESFHPLSVDASGAVHVLRPGPSGLEITSHLF